MRQTSSLKKSKQNKTQQTDASVEKFVESIKDEQLKTDCRTLLKLFQDVTKEPPKMWGSSMVGFGTYHYKYASGREGDWFLAGFSPRKQNLTLYVMSGFNGHDEIMKKLGSFKTGSSCIYVKRLSDIDLSALKELVRKSVAAVKKRYK